MNRTYRKRQQRKAALQGAAMLLGIVGTVALCAWWFPKADCMTAQGGLDFIARCEASESCKLSAREMQLKETYTRMEIKSCPRKD